MVKESLLWEYARGDLNPAEFQEALFEDLSNEELFGNELWIELISCNYSNRDSAFQIRMQLLEFLRDKFPQECRCLEYKNIEVIDMFNSDERGFSLVERLVERGRPFWWLYMSRCRACGQYWLVGQEERQNDVFVLKRLSDSVAHEVQHFNTWPNDFNAYESLLKIGSASGRRFFFIHPDESPSLSASIEELASAKPGITLSEISELLNLDRDSALRICGKVVEASKVIIDFEL